MITSTRRQFLAQSALAAGAFSSLGQSAMAQGNSIVATAYGGNWHKGIMENIVPCFKKATGAQVDVLVGQESEWIAKILAQRSRPPIDVLVSAAEYGGRLKELDIVEQINPQRVPNLRDVPSVFFNPAKDTGPVFNYGSAVICYNADKIPNPPTSIVEFIERSAAGEFGRKVTIPGITYPWTASLVIWNFADVLGGSVDKTDMAFEAVRKIKPFIPKFYTSGPEVVNMFRQGEANIGLYVSGPFQTFRESGANYARWVKPREGAVIGLVYANKVKNSPDLAWDYINCMLDPVAGAGFATHLPGYAVSNQKAVYSPLIADKILPPDQHRFPPFDAIQALLPKWTDRWNREIGAS